MVAFKVTRCLPKISTKTYRLVIPPPLPVHASEEKDIFTLFNVNDAVKNIDNLYGVIQSKDDNQLIVKWQDNTIERIRKDNLDTGYLVKTQILPNTMQTIPIDTKNDKYTSDSDNISEHDSLIVDDANISEDISLDTAQDDIIADVDTTAEDIDLQKIKENKKIQDLETKLNNKSVMKVKEDVANELASLAVDKGMIDVEDLDMEALKIMAMSEEEFKNYQQQVLNYQQNGEVTSYKLDDDKYAGLSPKEREAQEQLDKLKMSGKYMPQSNSFNADYSRRSLSDIGNNTAAKNNRPISMEDSLLRLNNILDTDSRDNIHSHNVPTTAEIALNDPYDMSEYKTNVHAQDNYDINNSSIQPSMQKPTEFLHEPFEGITRPLSLGNDELTFEPTAASTNLGALLSQLDWSTPYKSAQNHK